MSKSKDSKNPTPVECYNAAMVAHEKSRNTVGSYAWRLSQWQKDEDYNKSLKSRGPVGVGGIGGCLALFVYGAFWWGLIMLGLLVVGLSK